MRRIACAAAYAAALFALAAPGEAAPTISRASPLCPLEITGTWIDPNSPERQATLLMFAPDGWATVLRDSGWAIALRGVAERRPAEFEMIAQVRYQPVPKLAPRYIEFQAQGGNELFPDGKSRWEITTYTDESFTARGADADHDQMWSRVQAHRYFLTFAAREGAVNRDSAAFVMWTTLDGTRVKLEALGASGTGPEARFRRISDELTRAFMTQSKRGDDVMLRIELSEAEYHRSHQVFDSWDGLLRAGLLAENDPQSQALELLQGVVSSVNRCAPKIQPLAADTARGAERPYEFVRAIRKLNDRRHVSDQAFPSKWKPSPIG